MPLDVIGVGLDRTGTYSLKTVLLQVGFKDCYYMETVIDNKLTQVPMWNEIYSDNSQSKYLGGQF
jgi:hypothetical protein